MDDDIFGPTCSPYTDIMRQHVFGSLAPYQRAASPPNGNTRYVASPLCRARRLSLAKCSIALSTAIYRVVRGHGPDARNSMAWRATAGGRRRLALSWRRAIIGPYLQRYASA